MLEVQECATTLCYLGNLKTSAVFTFKSKVSPVSLALLVQDPGSISNVEGKVTKLKLHRICTHVACLDSYKQDLSLVQNGLYASPFYF